MIYLGKKTSQTKTCDIHYDTYMSRQKIAYTMYLEKDQVEDLKKINQTTEIPVAALIRRAVDEFLNRVEKEGLWPLR